MSDGPARLQDDDSTAGEIIQPDTSGLEITRPPAIVRGVMTVHFTKPTRVKKIGIRLRGTSKTEWPEVCFYSSSITCLITLLFPFVCP